MNGEEKQPISDTVIPIILCGGSGTRLWPLSRQLYPKQFVPLLEDGRSLFMKTLSRVACSPFAAPVVITAEPYRFLVREQLAGAEVEAEAILVEPEGRNTAPAVLVAALHVAQAHCADALMLVAPSDHHLENEAVFAEAVKHGIPHARGGTLVTFGISPTRAETGYGYLEMPSSRSSQQDVQQVLRFVEKPDLATAQAMLKAGNYLWNAGIFLFSAGAVIDCFRQYAPHIIPPVRDALQQAEQDLGFMKLSAGSWRQAEDISIDHAIMEKASNIKVVSLDAGWSDLGDWQAVQGMLSHDEFGNSLTDGAHAISCRNSLLYATTEEQPVVGVGLEDVMVVAMRDAVLVADKGHAQQVREVVQHLKAAGVQQATQPAITYRPWGAFECLAVGERFKVKRIVVKPGEALSLQCHMHRAEHWVVVQGTARVTIGDEQKIVSENESIYVPVGTQHRVENPGKLPLIIIEVQTGSYLEEDDIIRLSDKYDRCG